MKIIIDEKSGCCNGVGRAIDRAEQYLSVHPYLYSLGAIVHNDTEIDRLASLGLKTICYSDMQKLHGETILIRAHGEPPGTYSLAREYDIEVIDCTCPVVLALQQKIAKKHLELEAVGGRILIFGKRGHAEVNGLVGQTGGKALVIDSPQDMQHKFENGDIPQGVPLALFSQTTKDPEEFIQTAELLEKMVTPVKPEIYNTICKHVSSRHKSLKELAAKCDIIIFVCGKESSNGKVLFELCRETNPRSYKIETAQELDLSIFEGVQTVGLSGATSTTRWQIEKVADFIRHI